MLFGGLGSMNINTKKFILNGVNCCLAVFLAFSYLFVLPVSKVGAADTTTISNCTELQAMKGDLSANYQLADDIDCSATGISDTENAKYDAALYNDGLGFEPIGTYSYDDHYEAITSAMFTGQFDGNGKTISNLYIDRPTTDYVGLFGMLGSGSTVQDFNISSGAITGQNDVGAVAGMAQGDITIDNVTVSINVLGLIGGHSDEDDYGYCVGGLIGNYEYLGNTGLTLTNNTIDGTVVGDEAVGGLVGTHTYEWTGNSEDYSLNMNNNTVSAGSGVSGSNFVGGLIGDVYIYSNTDGVEASLVMDVGPNNAVLADVTGSSDDVGGLVGSLYYEDYNNFTFDFNISQSFVQTDVSAGNSNAGGLIGAIDMRCNEVDGFGDNCDFKVNISDSYYDGNVSAGYSNAGGLIGYSLERDWEIETLAISRSYAAGIVTANTNDDSGSTAGGFFGWSEIKGSISDSFAANVVDGNGTNNDGYNDAGTFIGGGYPNDVTFSNAYYDKAKNPTTDDYSAMFCTASGNAEGCNAINADGSVPDYFFDNYTNQPFTQEAPVWDFDGIWKTNATSYPTLRAFMDTAGPTFTVLGGGETRIVNIDEGQVITTNPYQIKVLPTDSSGVVKVEFYIDGILICTDYDADADGNYTCVWDTSQYHSEVKIIAYDALGNPTTITRSTTVSLVEVPKTGLAHISNLLPLAIIAFGVIILAISRKRLTNGIGI